MMTHKTQARSGFMNVVRFRVQNSGGMSARTPIGVMALAAMLALGAADARAQATPVCNNTPAVGERVECTEGAASTDDIDIDISGVTIGTMNRQESGITATHRGTGDIDIDSQSSTITMSGGNNGNTAGIDAVHWGSGNIEILSNSDSITTASPPPPDSGAYGIYVDHRGDSGDVTVHTNSTTIQTEGQNGDAIIVSSASAGKLDVDITGGSITTSGNSAAGIFIWHEYQGTGQAGPTTLDIGGNASITTSGDDSIGIEVNRRSDGLNRTNLGDATVETMGVRAIGILATQDQASDPDIVGNVEVHLLGGVRITTAGGEADGVWADHRGEHATIESDVVITARGRNTITTSGDLAHGLRGGRGSTANTVQSRASAGKVRMDLENIEITTKGADAVGIIGDHYGIGDIEINLRNATIVTEGTNILSENRVGTLSHGVFAWHRNPAPAGVSGDIYIDVQGGSIETRGTYSYGIRGDIDAGNGGGIYIVTGGGHTITTTGANAHGIVAYHYGTEQASSRILIDVGGSVDVSGAGAQGVRVGALSSGAPARVAAIGADGYRKHKVIVNGRVYGTGAGVFLSGGGRVVIGPQGTVGADSGIATRATGGMPKLLVDMDLNGRRMRDVINDWIINDGGATTIVVNDVMLHDGATGVVPGASVPNGAFDVTMRDDGLTVDTSSVPWTISERSTDTVADRDFSAADFIEEYAPRAAVYEALPGFLLRLNRDAGLSGERMRSPGSPLWLRLAAGTGSYGAERSTVGAGYDFRRFSAEAGMDFRLAEGLTGSLGARLVSGSADVSAPAGGGRIGAVGYGLSFGAAWQGAGGFYGEGRFTATWYNVDLSSAARGGLKKGAGAFVHAFGLEGGRRFALNEKTRLTARAWLNRSAASLAGFRDAVGARVSDAEANRFTAGAGAAVETDLALNGGKDKLSLRGSLGVEQALDGGQTAVLVSGTKLTSKAPDSRILLGLGATYRSGGTTLTGAFRADGLGSKDAGYSGRLELRTAF